ncbi:MAG TPA: hypothetical protein VEI97_05495 [bacterium]|nr:hypothetical protein [bacterium]
MRRTALFLAPCLAAILCGGCSGGTPLIPAVEQVVRSGAVLTRVPGGISIRIDLNTMKAYVEREGVDGTEVVQELDIEPAPAPAGGESAPADAETAPPD